MILKRVIMCKRHVFRNHITGFYFLKHVDMWIKNTVIRNILIRIQVHESIKQTAIKIVSLNFTKFFANFMGFYK